MMRPSACQVGRGRRDGSSGPAQHAVEAVEGVTAGDLSRRPTLRGSAETPARLGPLQGPSARSRRASPARLLKLLDFPSCLVHSGRSTTSPHARHGCRRLSSSRSLRPPSDRACLTSSRSRPTAGRDQPRRRHRPAAAGRSTSTLGRHSRRSTVAGRPGSSLPPRRRSRFSFGCVNAIAQLARTPGDGADEAAA